MKPRWRAPWPVLLVGLGFAFTLNCGTGGVVGGDCRAGLAACGHSCVNLGSDPLNCGACGRSCAPAEQCLVGVCIDPGPGVIGRPVDGGILLPDGGLLLPDGSVVGGGGTGAGGSSGGSTGAGASGGAGGNEVCEPPFNTARHCGDCDTVCEEPFPYCAPNGDSFECTAGCTNDLLLCGDRCVDPSSDIDHCGGCDQRCPTAICRDYTCVGGIPGHVVAICMNLQTYRTNAPQNLLLGNAVFLAQRDPVRVLGYVEYASTAGVNGVQRALDEADDRNARDVELTLATSAAQVAQDLDSGNYDALLVYDQELAPAGELASIGQSWLTSLETFASAGGVVVVLSSAQGVAQMHELISAGNLLSGITGQSNATAKLLYNREPSDAVGLNVFGEFRALSASCTYEVAGAPAAGTVFVVTDEAPGGALGNPSVIHGVKTLVP